MALDRQQGHHRSPCRRQGRSSEGGCVSGRWPHLPAVPVGEFTLWAGPSRPLQDFLLQALRAHHLRRLSKRRPLFQAISEGIDRTTTLPYLWSPHRPEVKKAALRVLMTGGAVTQAIASKWVPGGKI